MAIADSTTASTPSLTSEVLQRQRVDDGGEHAHVVAGDAVAALRGHRHAAEDVAAADDDADLDAERPRLGNVGRDPVDHRNVDAEMLVAHQRLARRLEQDAPVFGPCRHGILAIVGCRVGAGSGAARRRRPAIHEGRRDVTRRPSVSVLQRQKRLMPRYFFTVAATSAAKSVTSLSMPSPRAKRT